MRKLFLLALVLVAVPLLNTSAQAEIHVPSIIGDNMVLQQGPSARLWGTAQPAERVTATFAGQTVGAIADSEGHWQIFLGPVSAGGPYVLTITGSNTLTFKN